MAEQQQQHQRWVHGNADPNESFDSPIVVLVGLPKQTSSVSINRRWFKRRVAPLAKAVGMDADYLVEGGKVQYIDWCSHVPVCAGGRCCVGRQRCSRLLEGIRSGRVKKVVRLGHKEKWNAELTKMLTPEEFENIVVQRNEAGDKRTTFIRPKTVGEEAFCELKGLVAITDDDDIDTDDDDEPMVFARTRRFD